MLRIILLVALVSLPLPSLAQSKISQLGRASDWELFRVVFNSGKWSCQAINNRGMRNGAVLLYVMRKGDDGGYFEFHNGFDAPANSRAQIIIGTSKFTLVNSEKKQPRAFYPTSARDVYNMERAARALSGTSGKKRILVVDRHKNTHSFSAKKTDVMLDKIHKACGKK